MPIHDWEKAPAGLFHHFHQMWAATICNHLNAGVLPKGFFALVEQRAPRVEPDVMAVQRFPRIQRTRQPLGGTAVAEMAPPQARIISYASDLDVYAAKANRIVVRNELGEVVSVIEIVSPGNKHGQYSLREFVTKSVNFLRQGVHLLVIDPFPPSPRDPQGIHPLLWSDFSSDPFELPPDKPLTVAAYCADFPQTAYVEPIAVGDKLPAMPLFLELGVHVLVRLEDTYEDTWSHCPIEFREAIEDPDTWLSANADDDEKA